MATEGIQDMTSRRRVIFTPQKREFSLHFVPSQAHKFGEGNRHVYGEENNSEVFGSTFMHFIDLQELSGVTGFQCVRLCADPNILLQWYQNKRKEARAVRFFLGLFGLTYLRSYVGEITFFARLPWVVESDPPSDILSVYAAEEDGLLPHPPILSCADWITRYTPLRGSQQSNAVQSDARHEVVLGPLHRRFQGLRARFDAPRRNAAGKQMRCELKPILRTLGVGLLEYIWLTLKHAYIELRQ
ncbi:hypothetical protein EDD17DRAFT_1634125 [Pisolithus thermaeus]|nr:hypothetical protein EDD17DRAFT_1634125 [Pisolithus thermaeus]